MYNQYVMIFKFKKFFSKMARYAVLHREEVKNDRDALNRFLHLGYATKVHKKGQVFYELTEKSLELLESYRKSLLEEVRMRALLSPWSKVYAALLGDLRFLNSAHPEVKEFLFLSDWQLQRHVVPSQLELSKYRYYEIRGLLEKTKVA